MADIYTVTITGYSSDGEGVARLEDGRVVFIPGAARGDILEIKLTQEKPRSAHGEICSILSPSEYRIAPDCPYYPGCGGCDFRHISYEEELWAKLQRVNDALSRIAGLSIKADEILRTGQTDGYRNKAVFNYDGGRPAWFGKHSHDSIQIEHCKLLKDDINETIQTLPNLPNGSRLTVRSGRNGIAVSNHTVGNPASNNNAAHNNVKQRGSDQRMATMQSKPAQLNAIQGISGQSDSTQFVSALPKSMQFKSASLEEELDGLVFGISGFFQVNSAAALLLYQKAREYASMTKSETLVDLYCGVGSLTLFVGRDAGAAIGVELEKTSIKKARDNARRNNLRSIEFICADAASDWESSILKPSGNSSSAGNSSSVNSSSSSNNSRSVNSSSSSNHSRSTDNSSTVIIPRSVGKTALGNTLHPDCVIIDPPRKGLSSGALRKVLSLNPERIVYVSCDPATLARDLKLLEGYYLSDICAVDMFPRTANVECCCLLRRR